jgi:hypothetical protein
LFPLTSFESYPESARNMRNFAWEPETAAQTSKKADVTSKGQHPGRPRHDQQARRRQLTAPKLGQTHVVTATGSGGVQGSWSIQATPASAPITAIALCLKATFP